jgi:hypothetical protein
MRRKRRTSFERLSDRIARSYRAKGYSAKRARYIGDAAAGRVARRKRRRR